MTTTLALLALALPPQQFHPFETLVHGAERIDQSLVADFDGDGRLDVVGVSRGLPHGLMQPGLGDGTVGETTRFDLGLRYCASAAAGDLNGDGHVDLVAFSRTVPTVAGQLLLGRGDGTFESPLALPSAPNTHYSAQGGLVDLDGDGDLDLISLASSDSVTEPLLFENLGGVLAPPAQILPGLVVRPVWLDVDADGDLDLFYHDGAGTHTVALQGPAGVFAPTFTGSMPAQFTGRMHLADLDGDGDEDAVLDAVFTGEICVLRNDGQGVFVSSVLAGVSATYLRSLTALDFDLDGDLDLVGTGRDTGTVSWLRNDGALQFVVQETSYAGVSRGDEITLGDLDGNGIEDIVLTFADGSVGVILADAAATPVAYPGPLHMSHDAHPIFTDLALLDIDGDGDRDLLSASAEGMLNMPRTGLVSFDSPATVPSTLMTASLAAGEFTTGDLDGDSDLDVVLVNDERNILWLENLGTGAVTPHVVDASATEFFGSVVTLDVDADGDLDLATWSGDDDVILYRQTTPGTFSQPGVITPFVDRVQGLHVVDIDADGHQDLLVHTQSATGGSQGPWAAQWLRNRGTGAFEAPVELFGGARPILSLVQANFSQDPSAAPDDFAWVNRGAGQIEFATGPGPLNYQVQQGGAIPATAASTLTAGDIDHRPGSDLIAIERGASASVALYSWGGNGSFSRTSFSAPGLGTVSFTQTTDVDGDGDQDLLLVDSYRTIKWLSNTINDLVTTSYCGPAVPNSVGRSAQLAAYGQDGPTGEDFILFASGMPTGSTTLFLASPQAGYQGSVVGSVGALCLGGSIGRFIGAGQVQISQGDGYSSLEVNRNAIPQPTGFATATAGSVWKFQAWYRDTQAGQVVSNFTDGLAIGFQ